MRYPFPYVRSDQSFYRFLPDLSKAELKVYIVLARHADRNTGECYPKSEDIARAAGIEKRSVLIATKSLEKRGLITKKKLKRSCLYTLQEAQQNNTSKEGLEAQTNSMSRGSSGAREQPQEAQENNPVRRTELRVTSVNPPVNPPATAGAAAGVEESPDPIRQALTLAGIGEPARSDLATLPGLTPRAIHDKAAWCRERGKGVPVLIAELRLASEQHVERQRKLQQREQTSPEPSEQPEPADETFTFAQLLAEQREQQDSTGFPNASDASKADQAEPVPTGASSGPLPVGGG